MILFIPIANGQSIPSNVLKSIVCQTEYIDIIPCSSPGVINSGRHILNPEDKFKKLYCECVSRNIAKSIIIEDELVAMQDRDIVHLYPDNFTKCIDYMKSNLNIGAVAMPWQDEPDKFHIRNACFIIRSSVLSKLNFRIDRLNHICETMRCDIYNLGFEYKFFPSNKKLIQEI